MTDKDIIALLSDTANEKVAIVEMETSVLGKNKNYYQQRKLACLYKIGASNNFEKIIAAETGLVNFELREHANDKAVTSSLTNALRNLETVTINGKQVQTSSRYKEVNINMSNEKMRDSNGLPLDGARIAFKSHITRLSNEEKNRSTKLEKDILKARINNMQIAQKIYIDRQYKALGIEPPTVKKSKEQKIIDALALSYLKENHISPDSERGKQFIKAISNEAAKLQTKGKLPKPQILDSKAEPKPRTGEKSTPTPTRSTPNKKQDIER